MERRRTFVTAGIVLVVAIAAGVFIWYVRRPVPIPEPSLTMKSTRSLEKSAAYEFVVDIPALDGLADVEEQRAVNAVMRTPIIEAMDRLREDAVAAAGTARGPYRYESSFEVVTFTERLVSVRFAHAEYLGSTLPLSTVTTFTYDFDAHAEVTLDDLFTVPPKEYLPILSLLAERDLLRQLGLDTPDADRSSTTWVARGTAPGATNFAIFDLADGAIEFHFLPTTVAPSADGVLTARVPYAALREIVKPGSVIAGL